MRKHLFLIAFFVLTFSTFAKWTNAGLYESISADINSVKNFVISEDSKYIYTVNDSAKITKWNLESGDSISSIKILPIAGYNRAKNWYFISSDAKTYIVVGWNAGLHYKSSLYVGAKAYIYDINTNNLIDSIMTYYVSFTYSLYKINFETRIYDYLSDKNILLCSVIYDYEYHWAYDVYAHSGKSQFFIKKDTNWILKKSFEGKPLYLKFQKPFFFFRIYHTGSNHDRHNNSYWSSTIKNNFVYNIENDSIDVLSYYEHTSQDDQGSKEQGYDIPLNSVIIRDRDILFITSNQIKEYNFDTKQYLYQGFYSEYTDTTGIRLASSDNPDYYFIISPHSINVHSFKNHRRSREFKLNDSILIRSLWNTPDSKYIIFSDYSGNLYKISNGEMFKLYANFYIINKPVITTGDTVKFSNTTIGNPVSFLWDFGDGHTSTLENPSHVYQDSGYFNVTLKAINNSGDTSVKTYTFYVVLKNLLSFDYKIIPKGKINQVVLWNTTNLAYDSISWQIMNKPFEWEALDEDNLQSDTVSFNDTLGCNYYVRMILYADKKEFKLDKKVYLYKEQTELPDSFLISQYTDTTHNNYEAVKGYDEKNGNLIFQINGYDSYYGLINNNKIIWQVNQKNTDYHIIRRAENVYTFAGINNLFNFDGNNKTSDTADSYPYWKIKATTSNHEYVVVADAVPAKFFLQMPPYHLHNYDIYDLKNKIINSGSFTTSCEDIILYSLLVRKTGEYTDYAFTTFGAFVDSWGGNRYSNYYTVFNGKRLPFWFEFKDFIRLNANTIIFIYGNNIIVFDLDSVSIKKFQYPGLNARTIKALSQNEFIVAGDKNGHPAFWVFREDGIMYLEKVLTRRLGHFNHVFISDDNNLLLSGGIIQTYPLYNPFYVKLRSRYLNIVKIFSDSGNIDIMQHFCYPNPTSGDVILYLFSTDVADAQIGIYDALGNVVINPFYVKLSKGINEYQLELGNIAQGAYYYKIVLKKKIFSGMFIKLY